MRYPAWKYLLILVVLVVSTLYALPSLYPDEPAVQISGAKAGTQIDQSIIQKAEQILQSENIASHDNSFTNNAALLRLDTSEAQLKAKEALRRGLGDDYVVALNLAPTTPEWLQKIGAKPMKLGLDLRGGVHFLLEVDMDKAISQRMETSAADLRRQLRDNKLKFNSLSLNNNTITLQFANNADRDAVMDFLRRNGNEYTQQAVATAEGSSLRLTYTDVRKQEIPAGSAHCGSYHSEGVYRCRDRPWWKDYPADAGRHRCHHYHRRSRRRGQDTGERTQQGEYRCRYC